MQNGWQPAPPAVRIQANNLRLPTATIVASAIAMEPAAMRTATAVESVTTVEFATALKSTIAAKITVAAEVTVAAKVSITAESTAAPEIVAIDKRASTETMKPRPGTDENSADKILRAIVSVGRASVRGIRVVAVGTYRRWTKIAGAYSDGNPHLRVSPARRKNQKSEHCRIF